LRSDVRLATTLHEEGSEHFVTALKGLSGFEEEATAGIFIHGGYSRSRVTFSSVYPAEATATVQRRPESSTAAVHEQPGKARGKGKKSTDVER
jgi:hypothetical protein